MVGTAGALALTLTPIGDSFAHQGFVDQRLDLRDFILNLGLLAPVGAGLRLRGWRPGALLVSVLALSGGIELLQFLLPIGRDASLLDIVANTAGAGIAAWVVPRISRSLAASAAAARWLAVTVLLAWGAQAAVTAWALQRDIPVAAQYHGQWTHVFGGMVPLTGVVTAFAIQGHPVRDGAVPNTDTLRAALADEGTVTLQLAVRDLGPSVGRAQVAGVTNGAGDLVAGVERDGCRIRFRLRMRGERLGLGPLSVMLPTSCRVESGATTIAGRATHASLAIAAAWDGQVRRAMLRLAPSLGWRLFAPKRWRGGAWDVLGSIAWLTVWGAPLALWLRAAWPPPRNLARPALLYAIGLVGGTALVAMASGLAVGTPGDAVGIALGWWLGGLAARRGRSLS